MNWGEFQEWMNRNGVRPFDEIESIDVTYPSEDALALERIVVVGHDTTIIVTGSSRVR